MSHAAHMEALSCASSATHKMIVYICECRVKYVSAVRHNLRYVSHMEALSIAPCHTYASRITLVSCVTRVKEWCGAKV